MRTLAGRAARVVALVALAAALNAFPLDLRDGFRLHLGLLLTTPLVLLLPPAWAALAVLVAQIPAVFAPAPETAILLPLLTLEAAWLSGIGNRLRSAALADVLFWAFFGLPLAFAWLTRVAGSPSAQSAVIVFDRVLTSVSIVLFAEAVCRSMAVERWLGLPARTASRGLRQLIFSWAFLLTAGPAVVMALGGSLLLRHMTRRTNEVRLQDAVNAVGESLEQHLRLHRATVVAAAATLTRGASQPGVVIQESLRAHSDFVTMLVTDSRGRLIETAPQRPELHGTSVADRDYFAVPQARSEPYTSGVFRGRGFGRDILVALSAPWRSPDGAFAGIVEGSLEVHRVATSTRQTDVGDDVTVVLVDATGRVIAADPAAGVDSLENIRHSPLGSARGQAFSVLETAPADTRPKEVLVYAQTFDFGIKVIAFRPVTAVLGDVLWIYYILTALVPLLICGSVWVATLASRRLAAPLERFALDAVDQAESGAVTPMTTPAQDVPREVAMVFAAFNCLAGRVSEGHAALVRANAVLDARVVERTRELQAAQQRAEAASRSKSEFVAMTGHEIRTPLNALIGLTETVVAEMPPGPGAQRLQTVHRTAIRMLGIVNDLLDLSRIEAGKLDLRNEPVELGALATELIGLFSAQAKQKQVALRLETPLPLPLWLKIDAPRLQQVLSNLLANALKFSPPGSVRLRITAEAETATGLRLRFAVIDQGPGLTREQQRRLFEPYVQFAAPAPAGAVGTGLGLVISRRLVQLLGGELHVQSEPGAGAEFHFSATFERTAALALEPSPDPVPPPRLRVLVVDDNQANQEVLRAFLEPSHRVVTASSVAEAFAAMRQEEFDVAFIDLEMPEQNGDALVAAIAARRQEVRSPNCVLVAVSAHADDIRAACQRLGFADFLAKPIDRAQLFGLLAQIPTRRRVTHR